MSLAQFVREYRHVRRAEGWGSNDAAYYRALPYRDLSGRHRHIWRIRARSYETFLSCVLEPLEHANRNGLDGQSGSNGLDGLKGPNGPNNGPLGPNNGPLGLRAGRDGPHGLDILDLGAGNGWLAHRLSQRGHRVLAVDLLEDAFDGLGALRNYASKVPAILAEFDRLPLAGVDFDLAIFNASLHYSTDYVTTLRESLRVLRPRGTLVILDSPMYSDPTSGARMVLEREARFLATHGFASNALPSEHFLTPARLDRVGSAIGILWRIHHSRLDWWTAVQRSIGGLRARRQPAQFPVIVGTRV